MVSKLISFITEPKKTVSVSSSDELDSDKSSSFRGNPVRKNGEGVIKTNRILLVILIVGFYLRTYKFAELFLYAHDQDLLSWFVKDVVSNHHLRLIGQETSTQGVFIGPLFYYLQIPFYFLGGWDPIYSTFLVILLGVFTIWSFYFVGSKVFNRQVGLIAAFIYSLSFYGVFNDREVVPTQPVILWTVWFFYTLHLIYKRNYRSGFIIAGILLGLIWHINVALIILSPLLVVSFLLARKPISLQMIIGGVIPFIILLSPFIVFELRHNFIQINAIKTSLSTNQHDIIQGTDKLVRVFHLTSKNITGIFLGSITDIKYEYVSFGLFIFIGYLFYKKVIDKPYSYFIIFWIFLYLTFFSLYSKIVSEYYLNGLNVIWILTAACGISYLLEKQKTKNIGLTLLTFFSIVNIDKFMIVPINQSGYLERKAIIHEIKIDSRSRDFPCVAISYITKPGYNFGYRYFMYQENLFVKKPSETIPVYTIVYPLDDKLFPVHKTFGAIGIIYPDYAHYNLASIKESCVGDNVNMTEPMFGLTQ